MFKSLRIIASTFFLILSAMIAGVLVRSLKTTDSYAFDYPEWYRGCSTSNGIVIITYLPFPNKKTGFEYHSGPYHPWDYVDLSPLGWFDIHQISHATQYFLPIWFFVVCFALLALLIRCNLKFSVKQMFLIVTLFGICLGMGAIH